MNINTERRLIRLENVASGHAAPTCIVVTNGPHEASEAAVARYRAEHPGVPENADFIVFVSGFSLAPRDAIP
jgi:hypothetical protein